ncbi:MAG: MlaD family protein [Planctomycetota bacterium]
MADGPGYSNSVRAGAFLISAVVLALAVTFILEKSNPFASKNHYRVAFNMDDGVAGLEEGAEVRVSGLKVGKVDRIQQEFDPAPGRILVHVSMEADIKVRTDARVIRAQPLLGNYSWLNFTTLGTGEPLAEGGIIDAQASGGLLATIVGPQNSAKANQMFEQLVTFTGMLEKFSKDTYPNKVEPMLSSAEATMSSVREEWGTWRGKVGSILDSTESGTRKFDQTMDDVKVAAKDARETLAHVRTVNLEQVDKLLASGQAGADRLASAMERIDTELVQRLPDVRAIMADLREGAVQAKLLTMEARRSPWKIFYRPSGDELARENLYEAARAFAIASSDMRVAGETLEGTLRQMPERFSSDPKFREELKDQVVRSMQRYEAAQKQLFDVLKADLGDAKVPEPAPAGSN